MTNKKNTQFNQFRTIQYLDAILVVVIAFSLVSHLGNLIFGLLLAAGICLLFSFLTMLLVRYLPALNARAAQFSVLVYFLFVASILVPILFNGLYFGLMHTVLLKDELAINKSELNRLNLALLAPEKKLHPASQHNEISTAIEGANFLLKHADSDLNDGGMVAALVAAHALADAQRAIDLAENLLDQPKPTNQTQKSSSIGISQFGTIQHTFSSMLKYQYQWQHWVALLLTLFLVMARVILQFFSKQPDSLKKTTVHANAAYNRAKFFRIK